MAESWSRLEVEAIVADYFSMLEKELSRERYSKAEHIRALIPLLNGRSKGSVEFKHANISAIMLDLGFPYIDGYKPRSNYQGLLADVVSERVGGSHRLVKVVSTSVEQAVEAVHIDDILSRVEPPPVRERHAYKRIAETGMRRPRAKVDYLEREARNGSLGTAGEHFVLDYERARLRSKGKEALADRIEHVSLDDDGAGFDIRSFDVDGRDLLIEVKTTAYGKFTPFYVSRNEVEVSEMRRNEYAVYRVFKYRDDPRLFCRRGAIAAEFELQPELFSARVG